jgi:competence protein ComGC
MRRKSMNLLVYLKNNLKSSSAFTLIETLIVISMSVIIMGFMINLAVGLYNNHQFINLISARQLDGYLAADFMVESIKNSRELKQQSDDVLDLFCFFGGKMQWLRFSVYSAEGELELRRALGGEDPVSANFGRNSVLIDGLDDLSLDLDEANNLVKITIVYQKNNYNTVIKRRINLR